MLVEMSRMSGQLRRYENKVLKHKWFQQLTNIIMVEMTDGGRNIVLYALSKVFHSCEDQFIFILETEYYPVI